MEKGTVVENYRILGELGRGRMAVVYLVEDANGHKCALKVLHASYATDEGVAMLRREARINRRLFHPSIARVEDPKHAPLDYSLVMEYAEGQDLGRHLKKKRRLSVRDTLLIAWEICCALEHAHSLGVIHRDIKPQNVIVGKDNEVKVTDFGLASAAAASIATLSAEGIIGTPFYTSPEQAGGMRGDERSDLYSLGATMYQMLTGEVPFDHEKPLVILKMHQSQAPRPIAETRPRVPSRLAALVDKAMAKNPSDRFRSAKAMRQALEEVAGELGIPLEHRSSRTPLWIRIKTALFHWPLARFEELITDLGANLIWVLLALLVATIAAVIGVGQPGVSPSATETRTSIPVAEATATATPDKTPAIRPTPSATRTPAPVSPTPMRTPSPVPAQVPASPTPTPPPSATRTPAPASLTPTPNPSPVPTQVPASPTPTPNPSPTPTPEPTPTSTPMPTSTPVTGNIAPLASRSPDNATATNAFDGSLDTFWVEGLGHRFTLVLSWSDPMTIDRIIVWDRPQNSPDNNQINTLLVTLSNGLSRHFGMDSGGRRCIDISLSQPQSVVSVTLKADDASGNNGLSDVEIWVGSKTSGPACSNTGSMP